MARPTPSVVKNSGEMRMISSCSVEPGSPTSFAAVAIDGKARERRDVAAPLVVIGDRRAVVLDAGFRIGVEDRDQPIGFRKRQRTEQDGIDDREDGEVRAETDRDRGERGQREGRSFAELAKGVAKIVHWNSMRADSAISRSFDARHLVTDVTRHSFSSFGAKSCDGIGFGGAERGQQRGEQADDGEDKNNAAENQRIVGGRAEEQRFHQPRDAGRGEQSEHETERGQPRALAHDEAKNVAHLRAERETNAEFAGALRDAVSDEAVKTDAPRAAARAERTG